MNRKIKLPENHTRSLSSTLIIVEKYLVELEDMLLKQPGACCNMIVKDLDDRLINDNLSIIQEARKSICKLAEKYGASKEMLSLSRILDARRTKIWEILTESLSKGLKGFGDFPGNYVREYDSDIQSLLEITNRIRS